jgi:RNA polymerase sigma-70 factor (ECF subfamily)
VARATACDNICPLLEEVGALQRSYMVERSAHDVSQLLSSWSRGDEQALEKLVPLVYEELHRMARRYLASERTGHTLQTTALINEVYLRLADSPQVSWQNRAHFFAICAQLMRRILTDFARSRHYQKRGGGALHIPFDEALFEPGSQSADILALDDALKALAVMDERKSRVVELRFFGGLSVPETAEVLKVSPETVMRDWKMAKVWLLRELSEGNRDEV